MHNEIVIIGQALSEGDIPKKLEACLCTDDECAAMEKDIYFSDDFRAAGNCFPTE